MVTRGRFPLCVLLMPMWHLFLFVTMFVGMVTNLILCINYEIEELRLMMKTRLLPGQRRALALINPALFLIIQRCDIFSLRSFFAMSWAMSRAVRILLTQKNWYMQAQAWGVSWCVFTQDPIQKDTILLNYCIDDIEAKCRKLRERRAQVFIRTWLKC